MRHTRVRRAQEFSTQGFLRGVSLHSHTTHSKESLEFIPQYARRSAFLSKVMDLAEWQYSSRTGNTLDCSRAYWTPPLSPAMAEELEAGQIQKHFGLPALVSLTDHDNCEAGLDVDGVVSIEWTVPCPPSFFHLGVHNLPRAMARSIAADMNAFTREPDAERLREMLAMLNEHEDVLVVLNHPLWDEGLIGDCKHALLLYSFLRKHGEWIHALELNGLRPETENKSVMDVAAAFDLPCVSGGDRHGREPNANVNLTYADTFSGFVREVRIEQRSEVVYMPQYRESLRMRQFETAWDILRTDHNRVDGRDSWSDRVFYTNEAGVTHPLSYYFGAAGPRILVPFLAVMHVLEKPQLRPVLRAALGD